MSAQPSPGQWLDAVISAGVLPPEGHATARAIASVAARNGGTFTIPEVEAELSRTRLARRRRGGAVVRWRGRT